MKITLDTLTKATRQLALENKKSDELDTELPEEVKAFFADDIGLDDDEVLNTEKEPEEDGKKADDEPESTDKEDEPKDSEPEDKDVEGDTAVDALADLKDAALDDTDKDAEIADSPDLDDEGTVLDLSAGKKDDEDKDEKEDDPEKDDKDDEDQEPADECNKAEHDAILVNEDEECKTVKVHVYDIEWDTSDEKHWDDDQPLDVDDDEDEHWDDDQIDDSEPMQDDMNARAEELGLPSETDLEVMVCPGDDMSDVVAEALVDEYEYCTTGFNFDVISDDGEVDESALGDAFKSIGQGIKDLLKSTLKGAAVLIAGLGGSFLFGLPGLLLAVCIAFGLMSAKESVNGVEVDEGLLGGVKDKLKTVIGVLKADPKKSKELNDKMLAAKKAGDKEAMKKIAGEVKALAGNGGKTSPNDGEGDLKQELAEGDDCCECEVTEDAGGKDVYIAYFDDSVPADAPAVGVKVTVDSNSMSQQDVVSALSQILEYEADDFPIMDVTKNGESWYDEFNSILDDLMAADAVYDYSMDDVDWEWVEGDDGDDDDEEVEVDERHGEFRHPKFKRDKWSDGPRRKPHFDDEEDDYADDYEEVDLTDDEVNAEDLDLVAERKRIALDEEIDRFARSLTNILACNLGLLFDDIDNDATSDLNFDEEGMKHAVNVFKFAAGSGGEVDEFTCHGLVQSYNDEDWRDNYCYALANALGGHLEKLWLEFGKEDEDEFVDAATDLLRGLAAASQFTDAGKLNGDQRSKMKQRIAHLVETYALVGGGMGVQVAEETPDKQPEDPTDGKPEENIPSEYVVADECDVVKEDPCPDCGAQMREEPHTGNQRCPRCHHFEKGSYNFSIFEEEDGKVELSDITADDIKSIQGMDDKAKAELTKMDPEEREETLQLLGVADEGSVGEHVDFEIDDGEDDDEEFDAPAGCGRNPNKFKGDSLMHHRDHSDKFGSVKEPRDRRFKSRHEVDIAAEHTKDVSTVSEVCKFLKECNTYSKSPALRLSVRKFDRLVKESPLKARAIVKSLDMRFSGKPVSEKRFCAAFIGSL